MCKIIKLWHPNRDVELDTFSKLTGQRLSVVQTVAILVGCALLVIPVACFQAAEYLKWRKL